MPNHHLTDSWLMDYAAGSTAEAHGLFVATHLALCPPCRTRVKEYEALGGALLDELPPAPLPAGNLEKALAALDAPPSTARTPRPQAPRTAPIQEMKAKRTERTPAQKIFSRPISPSLPGPLLGYLPSEPGALAHLAWHGVKSGLFEAPLPLPQNGPRTRLLLLQAGANIPRHSHKGTEGVLVLTGGLSDGQNHMRRGDVMVCDESVVHDNVADTDEDCLALVVSDGPIRLTGPLGRVLNLLGRF